MDDDTERPDNTQLANEMDAKYGQRTGAHNLRPRKQPSFAHLHTIAHTTADLPSEESSATAMDVPSESTCCKECTITAVRVEQILTNGVPSLWDGAYSTAARTDSLTEVRDASGGFVPVLLAIRERVLLVETKYVCVTLTN